MMKNKAILLCGVSFAAILLGCGRNSHDQTHAGHAHEGAHTSHGVEFKEGQGLTIPSITREMLGVQIVDVAEGKATRRIDLPLRVFKLEKSGNESVLLASGPIDTNLVGFLQPGTEVTIAAGGSTLGKVIRTESASVRLTGLAEVVVQLSVADNVPIGAFLDGKVTVTTKDDVVLIPRQALLKTAEGHFAYVVNGNHLFRTKIGVGGQEGDSVEVTDGLYSGDRVVLQPIMSLWLAELQAIRGGKACADGH